MADKDEDVVSEPRSSDSEEESDDSWIASENSFDEESSNEDSEEEDSDDDEEESGSDSDKENHRDHMSATARAIMETPPMTGGTVGQRKYADVVNNLSNIVEQAYKAKQEKKKSKR